MKLQSNLWKYFLLILTNRRNYIPILSIYFLTLPNSTAQQIGLYTAVGWIVGFLLEVPSGYFSDKFGHKKTLILAKIAFLISTLSFVYGTSLFFFILGSAGIAVGFALTSGTAGAFLHNTLVNLRREQDYAVIDGKTKANVSLISAVMILLLPLLTHISIVAPIQYYLIFDIAGIAVAFSLYTPKIVYKASEVEEKLLFQLQRFKGTGFYVTSLFLGLIGGFVLSQSPFRTPYVAELGLPIVLIGSIMALSRVFWFFIGHKLHWLKKIGIRKLLLYEIFFFSGLTIVSSQLTNPYLVGTLLAIILGYYHGRSPLFNEYYLKTFLRNARYKATMLSIKAQIEKLLQAIIVFVIGFAMAKSYSYGFLLSGIAIFACTLLLYPRLPK